MSAGQLLVLVVGVLVALGLAACVFHAMQRVESSAPLAAPDRRRARLENLILAAVAFALVLTWALRFGAPFASP